MDLQARKIIHEAGRSRKPVRCMKPFSPVGGWPDTGGPGSEIEELVHWHHISREFGAGVDSLTISKNSPPFRYPSLLEQIGVIHQSDLIGLTYTGTKELQ